MEEVTLLKQILEVIFGTYSFIELFGFAWFSIIGYVLYGLTETSGRDLNSANTPEKWSWKFWFRDNWKRYIVTLISSYVLFRFYIQFTGTELSNFEMLMMGLVGDGIGATAKKRIAAVAADRKKLMISYNNDNKE